MNRMIQIRNVPEALHRKLKARSAMAGLSLSEYLLKGIRRRAEVPTPEELRQKLALRAPVGELHPSPAELLRQEREGR